MDRKFVRKCAPIVGAFGLATVGLILPVQATNLLLNPSFESPTVATTESTTATGWTFYPAGEAERAQFFVHTGQWSVFQKIFDPVGGVYQTVTGVSPGSPYTLSGWEFAEANAAQANSTLDFKLTWEDSSGTEVGASALYFNSSTVSTSGFTQSTLSSSNFSTTDPFTGLTTDAPNDPPGATGGFTLSSPIAPVGATQVLVSFDYRGPSTTGPNLSTFLDDVDLEGIGSVPANAWAIDGSGDWNAPGNWTAGAIPNGAGQEADFFGAITKANHNVFTDVAVTAGILNFNNTFTYVIDGAGSLTLQGVDSGNAQVIVQNGIQEINLPTTIASNTIFTVSSGATLVIADPITISAGKSLSQSGTGTVTYESTITVGTGGSISFASPAHAAALNLQGTSSATVSAHAGTLQVDSLSVAGATNAWTSKLDVTDNDLIIHNGNLANTNNQIKQGLNFTSGSPWTGSAGITSSTAAADTKHVTGVGAIQNMNSVGGTIYTTFGGVSSLTNTDVLVRYTYFGDTNLDGSVSAADYTQIDNGFQMHLTGWFNGDFNYDGVVNGDDYTLMDNAFNTQNQVPLAAISAGPAESIASASGSAVPEPGTFGLLAAGAVGLLMRRRRNRQAVPSLA